MCADDCRTFLWVGTGQPKHDTEGRCSCVCEDEGWSDRNIFGSASCVPVRAHQTFGWVGLGVSVGLLCHSAYLLFRQVKLRERLYNKSYQNVLR